MRKLLTLPNVLIAIAIILYGVGIPMILPSNRIIGFIIVAIAIIITLVSFQQYQKINGIANSNKITSERKIPYDFIVLIIIAVAVIFFVQVIYPRINAPPQPTIPIGITLTNPSPYDIMNTVSQLPLSDQSTALQQYVNDSVTWAVNLNSITPNSNGYSIVCGDPTNFIIGISFVITDVNDYPQLNTLTSGQEIIVQGTITSIRMNFITLNNAKLIFLN
jgi:hypothetical protein